MKGIKKYLKDNLGIILALVAMILFLYIYPKTHNTFLTTNRQEMLPAGCFKRVNPGAAGD